MTDNATPVKYHIEYLKPDGEGYNISLPPRAEALNLTPGTNIYMELRSGEKKDKNVPDIIENSNAPAYIYGEKTEKDGKSTEGYYHVHVNENITIPPKWTDFLDEPAYHVVMETNLIERPHFRIYTPKDFFQYRYLQLKERGYDPVRSQPAILPFANWQALRKNRSEDSDGTQSDGSSRIETGNIFPEKISVEDAKQIPDDHFKGNNSTGALTPEQLNRDIDDLTPFENNCLVVDFDKRVGDDGESYIFAGFRGQEGKMVYLTREGVQKNI